MTTVDARAQRTRSSREEIAFRGACDPTFRLSSFVRPAVSPDRGPIGSRKSWMESQGRDGSPRLDRLEKLAAFSLLSPRSACDFRVAIPSRPTPTPSNNLSDNALFAYRSFPLVDRPIFISQIDLLSKIYIIACMYIYISHSSSYFWTYTRRSDTNGNLIKQKLERSFVYRCNIDTNWHKWIICS